MALGIGNLLASEVHIFDLRRETLTQLTFSGRARDPVLAPDGIHLVYVTLKNADGTDAMWRTRRDGGGQPEKLLESSQQMVPNSISPDGRHLAYTQDGDLWILPLETRPGKPRRFFESPRAESFPAFSPDGHWLAYQADDSGRQEIYARPFPGPGGKSVISAGEGRWPSWSADGHQIFYQTSDGQIMVVDCQVKGDSILAGKPHAWPGSGGGLGVYTYAVTRDGKRVAVVMPPRDELDDPKASLHLMFLLNFFDEVKRRIP
jgi:Tol biopolymer transport system component